MTKEQKFSPLAYARIVGLLYIVTLVFGFFAVFVQSKLIVPDNAAATSANILASESLFRLSIVSNLCMFTTFIFAALIWYKLLKPVNISQARLMLVLILISFPIGMLNELNQFAAFISATGNKHEQMMLFLNLHKHGVLIAGIFSGLWLFPLGLLIYKSGFLPKFLGVLLMIGCFGYLTRFFQGFIFPGSEGSLWSNPLQVVTHVTELLLMLWLLAKGLDAEQWKKRALEIVGE
jgi:hypothetical protein